MCVCVWINLYSVNIIDIIGHASSTKLCSLDEQTTELISELPVMLKVEQAQLGVPSQTKKLVQQQQSLMWVFFWKDMVNQFAIYSSYEAALFSFSTCEREENVETKR